MKKLAKKSKNILLLFALALLALIGATIAYYTSQQTFDNELSVKEPGVAVIEKFNPADHWVPGEEKIKEVWFTNTGQMDMLLRFHVETKWADGKKPNGATDADAAACIQLNQKDSFAANFVSFTENSRTYYYYKKVLKPGESTTRVLDSVTFSSNISNDTHGMDYSDSQVNIAIIGETILAAANDSGFAETADEWDKSAKITESAGVKTVTWSEKQP